MRIGISCNAPRYAGGTERYALDIARGLQHNTTQHNTTQHNTTQHNTTQHNTI